MKKILSGCLVAMLVSCSEGTSLPPAGVAVSRQSLSRSFASGSLIIPMDTAHQNDGMLRAYGLVYALLRNGIPVHWAIREGKAPLGVDFTATAARDALLLTLITDRDYRGGPFVIDSADVTRAMPIITAWNANMLLARVVVHESTDTFSAEVKMTLRAAPRIAVMADGDESAAFTIFNAAGIPDSTGTAWAGTSPDLLTNAQLRGQSSGSGADGVLLRSDGTPAWNFLAGMHNDSPDTEVVREVRQWLTASPLSHLYLQCSAVTSFENNVNGRFLSTAGVVQETDSVCVLGNCVTTNRAPPLLPVNRDADSEFNQYDGVLLISTGTLQSLGLASGSTFKPGTELLIGGAASGTDRLVFIEGSLDGNAARGQVTWLVGHEYTALAPIIANPLSNGARLMLNSLFASSVSSLQGQPNVSLTKSGPTLTSASTVTWTLSYANTGSGIAAEALLTDTLPAGATFLSATGPASANGNVITWSLGALSPGEQGSVTVTATVVADGTYANNARLDWRVGLTPGSVTSNTVSTVRDATAPDTSLLSTPAALTNSTSATFTFSATEPASFECSLDGAAFSACSSPKAYSTLADGTHVFAVRAIDLAGNVDATPASWTWRVDATAPAAPVFTQPSEGGFTTATPVISGIAEPLSTVHLRVDGVLVATLVAAAGTGSWSHTITPAQSLSNGPHIATAVAIDDATNVSPIAIRNFIVDSSRPAVPIILTPLNGSTIATGVPLVTGLATANTTVRVFGDGVSFGTVTSNALGAWSYQVTAMQAFAEGPHVISARAVSMTMIESDTAVTSFTVDLIAPLAPVIVAPTEGQVVNTASPIASGTSEPLSTVTLTVDGSSTVVATSDLLGGWTAQLSNLAPGPHTLVATARDLAGLLSAATPVRNFSVDLVAPNAPIIVMPSENQVLGNPRPVISGTAEANATVEVSVDGTQLGSGVADGSGAWSFTPSAPLAVGVHRATARAVDAAGNQSPASAPRTFFIDLTAPEAPIITSPVDGSLTREVQPQIAGTSEVSTVVTVVIDGQVAGTASTDALGVWALVPSVLSPGPHVVIARATDAAGNVSVDSAVTHFTIDAIAPLAPVITSPGEGEFTDQLPLFTGTAEAGAWVDVIVDNAVLGTVLADMNGEWSLRAPNALIDGSHVVAAVAHDQAGNSSPRSVAVNFTVRSESLPDAGELDAGSQDAGELDGGAPDAGAADAGAADAGAADAGAADAGAADAGVVDAGASDAGGPDAGQPDAGFDAGSMTDAGPMPMDAGVDAGELPVDDAGQPDPADPIFDFRGGGCGCTSGGFEPAWLGIAGLVLALRRRRTA
ncbi:MAG: Ig-like domain-containing protein [Archangium sp.]